MSLWIGYFCPFFISWSTFLGSQQFVIDWTWWCFLAFHSVEVPFELPQVIKLEGVSDHRCGPEMHLFSLLIPQGELQLPEKTNKQRKQRFLLLQLYELKLFLFSSFEFLKRWWPSLTLEGGVFMGIGNSQWRRLWLRVFSFTLFVFLYQTGWTLFPIFNNFLFYIQFTNYIYSFPYQPFLFLFCERNLLFF